jgi:hypothetical protein
MTALRNFTFTYSPLFALGTTILGLYVMAIAIGFSLGARPATARHGSYRIFFVPAASNRVVH